MKTLLIAVILMLILVGKAEAQKTCARVTSTSQNCLATVSWTASVVDATHDAPANYVIRRGDAGGAPAQIGTVAAPVVSFQNTFTDAGGVAHCWEVLATKAAQSSPPSTQVCWTTPAIAGAAPNAPQGVSVAAINSSVLRISWDDSDGETGYEIYGKPAQGQKTYDKLIALGPDVTTWDWGGRKRYSTSCVEIMALGNPNSPFSPPICGTTSK
jgi:hypothetical protein